MRTRQERRSPIKTIAVEVGLYTHFKSSDRDQSLDKHLSISLDCFTFIKEPLLTINLCAPNEKQDKGNLGQKGLSDNTKVDFGATKNHG